ncbi:MAG: low-specificity L-threonine aldolase [Ignavibacteria bacterium]|nr:low-specificity L-threonine aldolase [Ignavibacteria bacterium]
MIDLRSDTVTKPSKEMLEFMTQAEVGDDVFGEDPTVIKLQKICAELTGKDDALFVPTGCMANQLAIKAHTNPGDEVIVEFNSHIMNYETAAPAIISRVQLLPITGVNGIMDVSVIKKHIRPNEYYFPKTKLISLENTHNRAGGIIQPIENIKAITDLAKENNIKTHLDGARIFNASVETGISVKEYASYFDSISFCFSKGLGAPIGSILCGDSEFIKIAHKWRKILGGGMRQVGVIAAAALYALKNNVQRLKEDHKKAKLFAEKISNIKEINIDLNTVQTNIVIFSTTKYGKQEFIQKLKERGVLISSGSYDYLRAVFHLDVHMCEVEEAAQIVNELF